MSDTDSLSGISFYLDYSIFALASPATHARSTLSTTVSSLSLPPSFPRRYYPPVILLLPSPLSFTPTIPPFLPSTLSPSLSLPPSFYLYLSLAPSSSLSHQVSVSLPYALSTFLSPSIVLHRRPILLASPISTLIPSASALISRRCRLSTPYTRVHHTIGPDLDTIRAVLNSTFRRFGPSFFSPTISAFIYRIRVTFFPG